MGDDDITLRFDDDDLEYVSSSLYLFLVSLSFIFRVIIYPTIYKLIIGIVINHIVMPLASGVIIAPNTTKINNVYLQFSFQNEFLTTPNFVINHIIIGS